MCKWWLCLMMGLLLWPVLTEAQAAVNLDIPDTTGRPGEYIRIPVYCDPGDTEILAAGLTITFDEEVLKWPEVSLGEIVPYGWILSWNTSIPGEIRIGLAGVTPISDSGILLKMHFTVKETVFVGQTTNICVEDCEFNDGSISWQAACGVFTVNFNFKISGYVRYYWSWQGMKDVKMYIWQMNLPRLDTSRAVFTNANGYYSFNVIGGLNYTVWPSKPTEEGWDPAISSWDASLILLNYIDPENWWLSDYQKIAGDVSGDGKVSPWDASYILQYATHLIEEFPAGDWRFQPDSRFYPNLNSDVPYQDYFGILIGDVSGDWTEDNYQKKGAEFASCQISIPEISAKTGQTVTLPINIEGADDILALDIVLDYNPEILRVTDVSQTKITQNYFMAYKDEVGKLRAALAGTKALKNGSIVEITFEVKGNHGESELKFETAKANEMNCQTVSGKITVDGSEGNTADKLMTDIFAKETARIKFSLSEDSRVSLRIYDVTGRLVKTLVEGKNHCGKHVVVWDGRNEIGRKMPPGIYFCRLEAGSSSVTKKLVFVK